MKNINEVFQKVKIPMTTKSELVDGREVKTITDIAGSKAYPVKDFIKEEKSNDYELVQKTIVNKLGKKRKIWIKKFYDNKNDGASAYAQ